RTGDVLHKALPTARLIVIESVIPTGPEFNFGKRTDLCRFHLSPKLWNKSSTLGVLSRTLATANLLREDRLHFEKQQRTMDPGETMLAL
ncbi:MAG TPA: hypothetical protein VGM27_24755, partial [Acidobacteriaceae bacterium]